MASLEHLSPAFARLVLATVAGLAVVALAPTVAAGWWSGVVVSGSMAPALRVGDVVITRPLLGTPEPGRVVAVHDPGEPSRVLVHRAYGFSRDGRLVTKGDANAGPDSTPVDRRAVIGAAVVRVPAVGLPVVWIRDGDLGRLGPAAGGLLLLTILAARRTGPGPALRAMGRHAGHPGRKRVPAARHVRPGRQNAM